MNRPLSATALLCLFSHATPVSAGIPAFPGAEGGGALASGGRGGKVFTVTNLNDDGPGSLREAIKVEEPRIIVFATSGTIELKSTLRIKHGNLTIAGQSAPGGGICLKNYGVDFSDTSNVIIRHLRVRPGDGAMVELDAMGGRNCENVIVDHCSASWSVDETLSIYNSKKITVQWCIVSESLFKSSHHKGEHGYGGIWGGTDSTWHHNLIANHTSRNPRFSRDEQNIDFRNNLIYNWGFNSAYGGENCTVNIINNYYQPGPATQERYASRILDSEAKGSRWFVLGNYVAGRDDINEDNWQGGVQEPWGKEAELRVKKSFPAAHTTTQSAVEARESILRLAGATLPRRDAVDQRISQETRDGKSTAGKSYITGSNGIIDHPEEVGGWPILDAGQAQPDTDRDGMPDAWEAKHQLDPKSASDGPTDLDNDGYTNVEEFLNATNPNVAEPNTSQPVLATALLDEATKPAVFFADQITVSADGKGNVKTIQEAIDQAPAKRTKLYTIRIEPGVYRERITIPADKSFLKFKGGDAATTIISSNLTVESKTESGKRISTPDSATLLVQGNDFSAEKITIENSHGPGVQALACYVAGDRAAFKGCQLLGWQDTLRVENGRSYFKECTVAGNVDFIYGNGTAFFDKCTIHCLDNGCIAAPSTEETSPHGLVFSKCDILADPKVTKILLARPWRPFGACWYVECTLPQAIVPEGWHNWDKTENERTARFAESENTGPGADISKRVAWAKQLGKGEAKVTAESVLGGKDQWQPKGKK